MQTHIWLTSDQFLLVLPPNLGCRPEKICLTKVARASCRKLHEKKMQRRFWPLKKYHYENRGFAQDTYLTDKSSISLLFPPRFRLLPRKNMLDKSSTCMVSKTSWKKNATSILTLEKVSLWNYGCAQDTYLIVKWSFFDVFTPRFRLSSRNMMFVKISTCLVSQTSWEKILMSTFVSQKYFQNFKNHVLKYVYKKHDNS